MIKNKAYIFPLILLSSVIFGGLVGTSLGASGEAVLKPIGNLFISVLLIVITPLVFFNVASATARICISKGFFKLSLAMILSFLFTGFIAAVFMLVVLHCIPLLIDNQNAFAAIKPTLTHHNSDSFFIHLFQTVSHINILLIIVLAAVTGIVTAMIDKQNYIIPGLELVAVFCARLVAWVMYAAPIGLFAYFAILVHDIGPAFLDSYLRISVIYYCGALIYFVLAFTFYAYIASRMKGVIIFWRNIFLPLITSLATCSSAASIPASLQAAKRMGVPSTISATVIPIGAVLHKDGSVLGGVLKIVFLFTLYHLNLMEINTILAVISLSILVGTVMGAIPSGGMLGELLIVSSFGFPSEALFVIAPISIIIDPLATMINVTGDSVCAMMVTCYVKGKNWVQNPALMQEVL